MVAAGPGLAAVSRDWRRGGSTRAWNKRRAWWAEQLPLPCLYCGGPVDADSEWHLAHIVPRSHGGTDRDSRPAHAFCNQRAGNRPVEGSVVRRPEPVSSELEPEVEPQPFRIY